MSAPDQRFALLRCGVTPSPAIVGARCVDVAPSEIRWMETEMEMEMRAEMGMLMGRLVLVSAFDARCSILD